MAAIDPPPCPVAGDRVADELTAAGGSTALPATYDWLRRLKVHCDQIEVIRDAR